MLPFFWGDHTADSGQNPTRPCWLCCPQRGAWPRFAPKFPSLCLILKKGEKKTKRKKNTEKKIQTVFSARLVCFQGRQPQHWCLGGMGGRELLCGAFDVGAFTRVTRGETRVLFMSGGEGGREPGGICFVRPFPRELNKTFQKLGGGSPGQKLK